MRNLVKQMLVGVAIAGSVLGMASVGQAACSIEGKAIRSYETTGGTFYTRIVPNSDGLPSYYNWYTTTDTDLKRLLVHAQTSQQTVRVNGDAPSCPTSGTGRNGGSVTLVEIRNLK